MNEIQQRSLSYSNSASLLNKLKEEPQYCECARFGSRALADGKMPVLRYLTFKFEYLDRKNFQLEHQHLIFSQSQDNIGLMGQNGAAELFQEDTSRRGYIFDNAPCLDGSIMRQAIQATGIPQAYRWLGYNCQAYAQNLKAKYEELLASLNPGMCK